MPYLSRIQINPLRAASRDLLANPRHLHGAVTGGIPGDPTKQHILWRLDADNPRRPLLFVLTETRPDWSHIVETAGWPAADGEQAAVRDYAPLLNLIAIGREFAFRLTANPVQNTRTPDKLTAVQEKRVAADKEDPRGRRPRSFRLGHRTPRAQLDWFQSRTSKWGFEIPLAHTDTPIDDVPPDAPRDVRISASERKSFSKHDGASPVTLRTATFEGRLRITDTGLFTQRLLQGVGPAKAYGCGLLTLAPLNAAGRPRP